MTDCPTTMIAVIAAVAVLTSTMHSKQAPLFVWHASESVPIGLYRVQAPNKLIVTRLVVASRPSRSRASSRRRYLQRGVPLIKRILALPGQSGCRIELLIVVDGIDMGAARERDGRGRALPIWQGCRVIGDDEVFLMIGTSRHRSTPNFSMPQDAYFDSGDTLTRDRDGALTAAAVSSDDRERGWASALSPAKPPHPDTASADMPSHDQFAEASRSPSPAGASATTPNAPGDSLFVPSSSERRP
jgi:type IV secretory pathway protease TraF